LHLNYWNFTSSEHSKFKIGPLKWISPRGLVLTQILNIWVRISVIPIIISSYWILAQK